MLTEDSHASDELLLLELEGELPPREAKAVRAHIEACWRCRTRKQELEHSIADFIQAYQQKFDEQLPPAAGPRAMLKAELAQISGAAPVEPGQWSRGWHKYLWAAVLSLLCVLAIVSLPILGTRINSRHSSYPVTDRDLSRPNTALTPGATILFSRGEVCSQANIKNKDVPASVRRVVFDEYGLATAHPRAYELDYLVTPALGGSDDIRNLWPHSYSGLWNARVKDALEDRLRDLVCGGALDLAEAQREIASNWIEAYKKYFHTDRPLPEHLDK